MPAKLTLYGKTFVEYFTMVENFRLPNPMHDDACFVFIEQGQNELYSISEKIQLNDRDAVLMKCGNYVVNGKASPVCEYRSIVFHLDPTLIKKAFGNTNLDFLRVNTAPQETCTAMKFDNSQMLENFMKSINEYFKHPELVTDSLMAVKLQELVLLLCDSGKNKLASHLIGTLYTSEEIAFDRIIAANLYNNLSVPELAFLTNRSESTFKRDFRKWYGDPPARYFKNKKLEKAASYLQQSDKPISEIAWRCGFENPAHFSSSFHEKFGKSPRAYKDDLNGKVNGPITKMI